MNKIIENVLIAITGLVMLIATACAMAFNLAVATMPIWGGALILMALFG